MQAPAPRSALDGWTARVIAILIAIAAGLVIAYQHRDTLFPPSAAPAEDDPFRGCIDRRWADIDKMAADGVIDAAQAAQFKTRAEALCRASGPAG